MCNKDSISNVDNIDKKKHVQEMKSELQAYQGENVKLKKKLDTKNKTQKTIEMEK